MSLAAVKAKVDYFNHREVITQEGWLTAALLGDGTLADKIVTTGLSAEHFGADPSLPAAENFPLNLDAESLAELRDREAVADAALAELKNNMAAGKYGNAAPGSAAMVPVFPDLGHDRG